MSKEIKSKGIPDKGADWDKIEDPMLYPDEKIPTAEEYLHSVGIYPFMVKDDVWDKLLDAVRGNTKLHVKAALKAAAEQVILKDYNEKEQGKSALQYSGGNSYIVDIDKQSILSAYDLRLIK